MCEGACQRHNLLRPAPLCPLEGHAPACAKGTCATPVRPPGSVLQGAAHAAPNSGSAVRASPTAVGSGLVHAACAAQSRRRLLDGRLVARCGQPALGRFSYGAPGRPPPPQGEGPRSETRQGGLSVSAAELCGGNCLAPERVRIARDEALERGDGALAPQRGQRRLRALRATPGYSRMYRREPGIQSCSNGNGLCPGVQYSSALWYGLCPRQPRAGSSWLPCITY